MDANSHDPIYVDDPFEDDDWVPGGRRPKWKYPQSDVEKMVMEACGRKGMKYYKQRLSPERQGLIMISKSAMSLDSGVVSKYPLEWIETICEWGRSKRAKGSPLPLKALVTAIMNEDRKQEFLVKHEKEYGIIDGDILDFF
jgi:hypothetical protein